MLFPAFLRVWLFTLVLSLSLAAQDTPDHRYLSVEIANDVFYLPLKTDRYFTSGLQLEWGKVSAKRIAGIGGKRLINSRFWRVSQDIFTPNVIDSFSLVPGDRPFASYLTLSRGGATELPGLGFRLGYQYTAGILGKHSFGGRVQNAFHGMIDFAEVIPGWVNEVKSDVILNYDLELEKQLYLQPHTRLGLSGRARVGSLYTDFSQSATLSLHPLRLGEEDGLFIDAIGGVRLVGYNATLSGGLFNRDDRFRSVIQPRRLVSNLGLTTGLQYSGWRLEGGVRWLSPEFQGGMEHLWAWFGVKTGS